MNAQQLSEWIEKEISTLKWQDEPKNLYEPIEYLLSLGGKRMRPLLVLLGYLLYRDDPKKILRPALSVEVFHNFTLMHDDIMDNAPLRRGQPTVHEKWNQTVAILSGDTMFVKAYQLLEEVPAGKLPKILNRFNQCAIDVCAGQQMDMNFEEREEVSEAEYLKMISLKTAALLGFSLELGGILADTDEATQKKLYDLGMDLGMAFQLMDDHLDTFGDENFGKKIGGDIGANKKTYLLITALAKSSEANRQALQKWLNTHDQDDRKIQEVTRIYREEGIDEISKKKVHYFADQALHILKELDGRQEAMDNIEAYITKLNQRMA